MKQAISTQQLEDAYDAYGTAVYRLAMAFLGQCADAEDVTQETFCRLPSGTMAGMVSSNCVTRFRQKPLSWFRHRLAATWRSQRF